MTVYATRADLYQHGLPRGLLVESARVVTAVDTSADTLTVENHGLSADDPLQIVEAAGGTAPSPLATETIYYAKTVTDSESLFQLAATAGGAAIDLTTSGTGSFGITVSLNTTIDAALEYCSRLIDQRLIAHSYQLTVPIPELITAICAKLAARELLSRLGRESALINEAANRAWADLDVFARGVPVRDANATASANSAAAIYSTDRGWTLDDGRVL